jgi:drug/metabolite transporter (DMT)-like permease
MLFSGIVQLICGLLFDPAPVFGVRQAGELLFTAVITAFLGHMLWNYAMRSTMSLYVILASNFLPILCTIAMGLVLGVPLSAPVLAGAALLAAGTAWSRKCFIRDDTA